MPRLSRRRLVAAGAALPAAMALGPAFAAPVAGPPARRPAVARQGTRPIGNRDIARLPAPGMNAPSGVAFSPDGTTLTWLASRDSSLVQQLWAMDLATGRESVLLDIPEGETPSERDFGFWEAMLRERVRDYALGVTAHAWGDTGRVLMARRMGEVLVRIDGGEWTRIPGSRDWADPQISPDETHLAFGREGEVWALDLADPLGAPRRLTLDASPPDPFGDQPVVNGLSEYWVQEELERYSGFWWSPEGGRILFAQADMSAVPRYIIPHQGTPAVAFEPQRYPRPGDPIARVRLGMVPVAGSEVTWLTEPDDSGYLLRVDWTPDGKIVMQWLARDNTRIALTRIDPDTGEATPLFTETLEPWVTATDDLRFIPGPSGDAADYDILWSSERTGWRELYRYSRDGELLERITDGDVRIDGVAALDAEAGWVAVAGWRDTPLETQLYRVPLAGGSAPAERITVGPGTHSATFGPGRTLLADLRHAADSPPRLTVFDAAGTSVAEIAPIPDPLLEELDLIPPEFVEVEAEDGSIMHGALYRPLGLADGERAPVVVAVYGGPGSQRVTDSWAETSDLQPQALASQGYAVFKLDNRGTARRGRDWETITYKRSGEIELADQLAGVEWLKANVPEADAGRTGIYGWSYGGYMTLLALTRAPEVFTVGAAGSPGTVWEEYDAPYTERYYGLPQENPEVYAATSALNGAGRIRGKLLLNHGLIDENVHFRHTARLIDEALNPGGVDYELLLFPEQRHHLRSESDRLAYANRVMAFFALHL